MSISLEQNVFDLFRKKIKERIALKTTFVVSGGSEDYANYREHVGELRELQAVIEIFEDLIKAVDPY